MLCEPIRNRPDDFAKCGPNRVGTANVPGRRVDQRDTGAAAPRLTVPPRVSLFQTGTVTTSSASEDQWR